MSRYLIGHVKGDKGDKGDSWIYLECSTARNIADKVVTSSGFVLTSGARIAVRFTDIGSSNPSSGNLTLNVNNTGAKAIVDGHSNKTVMSYSSADLFYNNKVADFVYDGTYWVYLNKNNDAEISDIVNVYGAKNLCPLEVVNQTVRGITITDSADGTYKVLNGTSTGNPLMVSLLDELAIYPNTSDFFGYTALTPEQLGIDRSKTYVFARNSYNNVRQRLVLYLNDGTSVATLEIGTNSAVNSIEIDFSQYTFDRIGIYLLLGNNNTYSNYALKPILMLKSIWQTNNTYTPYTKTNQQLTKETTGLIDNLEVNGAVNMLPNNATSQTINGITFTVNNDGSVTANGTATANAELTLNTSGTSSAIKGLETGNYKLSGCPSGGGNNTYRLFAKGTNNTYYNDDGDGAFISNTGIVYVRILIKSGKTVSNLTLKPMLTVPSYNGDYVSYAKSNRKLMEDVATKLSYSIIDSTTITLKSFIANSINEQAGIYRLKEDIAVGGNDTRQLRTALGFGTSSSAIIVTIINEWYIKIEVITGWGYAVGLGNKNVTTFRFTVIRTNVSPSTISKVELDTTETH